ncbi:hypothetical protein HanRHA438_Chr17g0827241 [Helianthus annuus]|nr:hypothetical protein HanIR_Chr17g0886891 [Helianthus annuus]KAJ0814369.1 hypothetical protein HanPSC8_Chr17g0784861 [Helianthus annuus]KAJ0827561.1 hypothetical protein HanRHA438_Chr17g0827241 [Helianthus annuus]
MVESYSHQAHNIVYGCGFVFRGFPSKFWVQIPLLFSVYTWFTNDENKHKTSSSI